MESAAVYEKRDYDIRVFSYAAVLRRDGASVGKGEVEVAEGDCLGAAAGDEAERIFWNHIPYKALVRRGFRLSPGKHGQNE